MCISTRNLNKYQICKKTYVVISDKKPAVMLRSREKMPKYMGNATAKFYCHRPYEQEN